MEDRLETDYTERPGTALIALAVILVVTAAWWALALWPVGAEPEWLARTRLACFGSARGGLPDAGGWILLIGEPIGMFGALIVLWGRSLSRDLRWLTSRRPGRSSAASVAVMTIAAAAGAGVRVARALPDDDSIPVALDGVRVRVDRPAPAISLVDQYGNHASFADFRGRTALVTFAFGHCAAVCPATVSDLRAARRMEGRDSLPIVIITLDPWRDTPERLPMLAEHWQLGRHDRVLSGPVADVEAALDSLGIGRRRNETTGDIDHTATVIVLDQRGALSWRTEGATFTGRDLLGEAAR